MRAPAQRFSLAPQSAGLFALTSVVFPMPFVFAYFGWRHAGTPVAPVLLGVAGFLGLIWLSVWTLFRPSAFEVTPNGIRISWPLRGRFIERDDVVGASIVSW